MRWVFAVAWMASLLAANGVCGVDVNSCTYSELMSLPGVGPRLATAILEEQSAHGDFRDAADLDRVKGIGPASIARLSPLVEFGRSASAPRPRPASAGASSSVTGSVEPIDINTAPVERLQELPGIGPVLASRILEHRTRKGPLRALADLASIRGVGPRRARALAPLVGLK